MKLLFFLFFTSLIYCQESITINAVGDLMIGTDYPNKSYLPSNSELEKVRQVDSVLSSADLSFANFEGVFLNNGKAAKKCKDSTKCYVFKTPDKYAFLLKNAGIDFVSLANNHSGDFGLKGRERTMQVLDSMSVHYAGLFSCPFKIIQHNNLKIGFASFAPNDGTLSINDTIILKKVIDTLNISSDLIVISFHGGAEGSKYQHVKRKREIFYGENRGNVYEFAHKAIDYGADLILGHGPHVTRALEFYKKRLIAYSLGNFWTYGRFNIRGVSGISPILSVKLSRTGEFLRGKIIPIKQIGEGIPIIDLKKSVIFKLNELNSKDFPNSSPIILENGVF